MINGGRAGRLATQFPLFLAAIAAAPAPPLPATPVPLTGNYAGDGAALRVVPTGVVVQGDCASGKIPVKVRVDRAGQFTANGYFNTYHPTIRLSDIARRDTQATFTGQLRGDTLSLTIRIAGKPDQRFQLTRDAPAKFAQCK